LDSISGDLNDPKQPGYQTGRDLVKAEILASVKAAVEARPGQNAAFLTMCDVHCGQWGTGQNSPGRHCHYTLSLAVIDCHSFIRITY
jgi:hypothetical protein